MLTQRTRDRASRWSQTLMRGAEHTTTCAPAAQSTPQTVSRCVRFQNCHLVLVMHVLWGGSSPTPRPPLLEACGVGDVRHVEAHPGRRRSG